MRLKMLASNGLMMQSVYEALLTIPYVQEYSETYCEWMENRNPEKQDQLPGLTDNPRSRRITHVSMCVMADGNL
ncbi:hypothetical protein [Alkalihalobacillus sp. TS-13]|uniref:hypothetical protein n=1 Tax=Alkalihalobacillus sp. TS-13 TaxID=2842455 RepID=UPI001C87CF97|nr:hypothetical protein [Alkalihalobacillus sp. TS-13]